MAARCSDYLPVAPRSSPLHLTPWVPDADQLDPFALITNLKGKKQPWVTDFAFNLNAGCPSSLTHLFCTSNRVGVSLDKLESRHCFGLIGTADLDATKQPFFLLLVCLCATGVQMSIQRSLTSIEQPMSEPSLSALCMIWKRFAGALSNAYASAMPPVKSSKPSMVFPPARAS